MFRPNNRPSYGIYNLTSFGMDIVSRCKAEGHHAHCLNEEHSSLYAVSDWYCINIVDFVIFVDRFKFLQIVI